MPLERVRQALLVHELDSSVGHALQQHQVADVHKPADGRQHPHSVPLDAFRGVLQGCGLQPVRLEVVVRADDDCSRVAEDQHLEAFVVDTARRRSHAGRHVLVVLCRSPVRGSATGTLRRNTIDVLPRAVMDDRHVVLEHVRDADGYSDGERQGGARRRGNEQHKHGVCGRQGSRL